MTNTSFHENHDKKNLHSIKAKVSGVTFSNNDGTERQTLLKHVQPGDSLTITRMLLQQKLFYVVRHELGIIGTVKYEIIKEYLETVPITESLDAMVLQVTGGGDDKPVLGCNIEIFAPQGYTPAPASQNTEKPHNSTRDEKAMAFIDPDGKNIFHLERHCSGLQNAKLVPFSHIKTVNARPCKRCAGIFTQERN